VARTARRNPRVIQPTNHLEACILENALREACNTRPTWAQAQNNPSYTFELWQQENTAYDALLAKAHAITEYWLERAWQECPPDVEREMIAAAASQTRVTHDFRGPNVARELRSRSRGL
jgi:hypothetical protein